MRKLIIRSRTASLGDNEGNNLSEESKDLNDNDSDD